MQRLHYNHMLFSIAYLSYPKQTKTKKFFENSMIFLIHKSIE